MRLCAYTRRSTERQEESQDVQESLIRDWCLSREHTLVRVYHEEVVSRRKGVERRPALAALVSATRETPRDFDGIIVLSMDRLFGNAYEEEILLHKLDKAKCALVAIRDPIDRTSAAGRFTAGVMRHARAFEAELTGERIFEHNLARVLSGRWPGGVPPPGYRYDKAVGKLVLDSGGEVGLTVFQTFLESGGQLATTCRRLNAAGYRTARGNHWQTQTLRKTLRAHAYRRRLAYGGRIVECPDLIPPLIPGELLVAVDTILARTRRVPSRAKSSPSPYNGFLICGVCGAPMGRLRSGKKKGRTGPHYSAYQCRAVQVAKPCDGRPVPEWMLETLLLPALSRLLKRYRRELEGAARRSKPRPPPQGKRDRLLEKRGRWVEMYAEGIVSRTEFRGQVEAIDGQLASLSESRPLSQSPVSIAPYLAHFERAWGEVPTGEKRGLLTILGAEILVYARVGEVPWVEFYTADSARPIREVGKAPLRWRNARWRD